MIVKIPTSVRVTAGVVRIAKPAALPTTRKLLLDEPVQRKEKPCSKRH